MKRQISITEVAYGLQPTLVSIDRWSLCAGGLLRQVSLCIQWDGAVT